VAGRVSLLLLFLLAAPVAAEGAGSQKAGSWSAPVVVAPAFADRDARLPVVALDGHGNATAVWEVFSRNGSGYVGATAGRHAGRGWTRPRQLAGGVAAQVAGDARGDLLAVWTDVSGTSQRIRTAFRPAGGGWQTPVYVSPAGEQASVPKAALDARGRALIVWTAYASASFGVESANRGTNGRWSQAVTVASGVSGDPDMAMNAGGRALVVWDGLTGMTRVASRSPSGNWTPPLTLSSPNDEGHNPRVALNAAGTAIAVWMGSATGQAAQTLEAAIRPAGGRFGSARVVVGEVTGLSKVALAANGEAVVISSDRDVLYSNVRPPGGRFARRQMLGTGGFAPTVGVDGRGDAIAVWTRSDGTNLFVHAARRISRHSFGAGIDLAPVGPDCFMHRCLVGGEAALAVSPRGSATAVWIMQPHPQQGFGSSVEAAEYAQP
jgi:hypothetical protein